MARKKPSTRRKTRSNPRGRLSVRPEGYGFVSTAEGEFFIPESRMRGAFDGDLVEISPLPAEATRGRFAHRETGSRKRAARIVSVVERVHDILVGRYEVAEPFGVVVPEDRRIPYDIFTLRSESAHVPDGAVVSVRIMSWPTRHSAATGVVEQVLGFDDDERVMIDLIVASHKLETEFSEASLAQASQAELGEDSALADGYRDLRSRFVFTVDPADARDFDDALSFEVVDGSRSAVPRGAVARVGVHIADVSHYVPWASSIDLDARRRATSVYLVDRVIPMLPERLSNDLCSLRPDEDRRCMTIDLFIDARGRVVSSDAYPALIRSRARLTYDQAQTLIDGDRESAAGFSGISDDTLDRLRVCIPALSRIAQQRAALRTERGGLDFDTVEARVVLDDEGCPIDVSLRRKTAATQMVEESMIMANEAAARLLSGHAFPGMYRVHEKPSADDLEGLLPIFQEFPWFDASLEAPVLAGDPFALARVLELSDGRPEHELIVALVLRSMKRAVYSPACDGHFGLASEAYTHFTSPIRRYPDLVVHRMMKALLFGRGERFDQEVSNIPWLAEHSSRMERTAERASRDSQEAKLVELMESQVGKRFSALIVGVATYGLFVRLPNTAEGLVPIDSLGREYFALDPVRHVLAGQDTAVKYRLGQRVDVVLTVADRQTRKLTFKLVPVEQDRPKERKKPRQRDIDRALRHQQGLDRG